MLEESPGQGGCATPRPRLVFLRHGEAWKLPRPASSLNRPLPAGLPASAGASGWVFGRRGLPGKQ